MKPDHFLDTLPVHPFAQLRAFLGPDSPRGEIVALEMGTPQHPIPDFALGVLAEHAQLLSNYPANNGTEELLEAISGWILRRYDVTVEPDRLMALNGSREGLFNAALALCVGRANSKILIPNPSYQTYLAAALAVKAEPQLVPAVVDCDFMPDYLSLSSSILNKVEAAYLCSPSNPQGTVASFEYIAELLRLAEHYDFRVFVDECYSEIYTRRPPVGSLQVAAKIGADPERLLVFNSLSKRSNLPGLRSGFVAGGIVSVRRLRRLRAYAGTPLPGPLQAVAARAWSDERHVDRSRNLYVEKFNMADKVFGDLECYRRPEAGMFLWLKVDDGRAMSLSLWQNLGIRVLPGAYLGCDIDGENPGHPYVRVAMVAPIEMLSRALKRIRNHLLDR